MPAGPTQNQSSEQLERAKELSLERSRPPTSVPGYEIERFLGSGAYGEVWVATDGNTGRRVAIKFYTHRGGVDWSLLSREVEKLVFLSTDRYVVQLLDVGWDSNPPYYVMDYLEHGSLDDHLHRSDSFSLPETIDLFYELANGLLHAHAKGVLHCDLKPANVLLDEDGKPRLADFGQSRLRHEQTPSLGTLFFMAPEQADLAAVPDARWDVYALGAIVFCALTGQPPYRNDESVKFLDEAENLTERLERYRQRLEESPPVQAHRKIPGMDKPLAYIIEHCLAVNPKERFANIQEVLDALERRDAGRSRRPLVLLGFVGPLLLLVIMTFFGWRGFERATRDSEQVVTQRALDKNLFAAKTASGKAAEEISHYFRAVQLASRDEQLLALIAVATSDDSPMAPYREQFSDPNGNVLHTEQRKAFLELETRRPLQKKIESLAVGTPGAASWFFADRLGVQLASHFDSGAVQSTIGKNFAWRTYFHGGPNDLVERNTDGEVAGYHKPQMAIRTTHISAPFQSRATNRWKVAVSEPVYIDDEFVGVVALTVDIGQFLRFDEGGKTFFASLVDGRPGDSYGMVLQHQMFESWVDTKTRIPDTMLQVRAPLEVFKNQKAMVYRDPLRDLTSRQEGNDSPGVFLAATAPVMVHDRRSHNMVDTGLVVIVQESFAAATLPVEQLGRRLLFEGGLALAFLLAVVLVLWGVVLRVLRDPENDAARRGRWRLETSQSSHDAKTLPAGSARDRGRKKE